MVLHVFKLSSTGRRNTGKRTFSGNFSHSFLHAHRCVPRNTGTARQQYSWPDVDTSPCARKPSRPLSFPKVPSYDSFPVLHFRFAVLMNGIPSHHIINAPGGWVRFWLKIRRVGSFPNLVVVCREQGSFRQLQARLVSVYPADLLPYFSFSKKKAVPTC